MKLLTGFDAPSYLAEPENECLTARSGILLWGSHWKNQIVGRFLSLRRFEYLCRILVSIRNGLRWVDGHTSQGSSVEGIASHLAGNPKVMRHTDLCPPTRQIC